MYSHESAVLFSLGFKGLKGIIQDFHSLNKYHRYDGTIDCPLSVFGRISIFSNHGCGFKNLLLMMALIVLYGSVIERG